MRRTPAFAALLLALAPWLACVAAAPAPPAKTELRIRPGFGSPEDGLLEGWRRYAQARIDGPVVGRPRSGSPDPPPFEEEVYAREFLARAWGELAARHGWRDRYLEELAWVQSEGWIREYTWQCLHVLRGIEPSGLDMEGFRAWFRADLPEHVVETWVTGHTEGHRVLFEVGRQAHAPYRCSAD